MNPAIFYNGMQVSADLEPIVQRTKRFMLLAFYRAAAYTAAPSSYPKPEAGSLEDAFADLLAERIKRDPRQRAQVAALAAQGGQFTQQMALRAADFGSLTQVNLKDKQSLGKQLGKTLYADLDKLAPAFVNNLAQQVKTMRSAPTAATLAAVPAPAAGAIAAAAANLQPLTLRGYLRTVVGTRSTLVDLSNLAGAVGMPPAPTNFIELRLNLVKVTCIDKMDWEITDFGDDDIRMGGKAVDTAGTQANVGQFRVHTFKRDNQSFNFNNIPYKFASFDLNRQGPWPRYFMATLAMAEKDADGGFIEFLQKIWDAIDEAVIQALADAVLAALAAAGVGAAAGAAAGAEAAGVGAIVGAIVGAAVGFIVAWVMDSLKDDIFEPVEVSLILAAQSSGFDGSGSPASPTYQAEFNRDGARYILHYNWTLQ